MAHVCKQFVQGRYLTAKWPGIELATSRVASQRPNHHTTRPYVSTLPVLLFLNLRENYKALTRGRACKLCQCYLFAVLNLGLLFS